MSENPNYQQNPGEFIPAPQQAPAYNMQGGYPGYQPTPSSALAIVIESKQTSFSLWLPADSELGSGDCFADSGYYWSAVWLADFRWRAGSGWRDSGYCCPGEGEERHCLR